jgi:CRISPR/Cas system-associated exonuclease Cas4 (RecB family)
MTITAWSPSRLSTFEQCPRKAFFLYVQKHKEPTSPAQQRGTDVHAAAEQYVAARRLGQDVTPPSELAPFAGDLHELMSSHEVVLTESQHALNRDLERVDWFARDVWLRVIFDVEMRRTQAITVIDYKTGKVREKDHDQMDLYAVAAFSLYPEITEARTLLWYTTEGVEIESHYLRKLHYERLLDQWRERSEVMLTARDFPARSSPLCRWCHFTHKHEAEVNRRYESWGIRDRVNPLCEEG